MSGGLLARAAATFVEPTAAPSVAAAPRVATRAVVLGRPDDAVALAAALAGELRARDRASAALLAVWPGERRLTALASPGARRLVARLEGRGIEAAARGGLAWLALNGSAEEACTSLTRAQAATDGPAVLAVCGPRCPAIDSILDDHDLVILAAPPGGDPALADLAVADLAHRPAPVVVCPAVATLPARLLALAGRGRLRQLWPALLEVPT